MTTNTELHISGLDPDDKLGWMNTAQVNHKPFDQWVIDTLNAATVDTNPEWANGLSIRTRIGLLSVGFRCREDVETAWNEGYYFPAISNFGRKCTEELRAWLKQ